MDETYIRIYVALAMLEATGGEGVCDWLYAHAHGALTVCPECHGNNFHHEAGCSIAGIVAQFQKAVGA